MEHIIDYLVREKEFLNCRLDEALKDEETLTCIEKISEDIIKVGIMITIAKEKIL